MDGFLCEYYVNEPELRRVVNAYFYRQMSGDFPYLNMKKYPNDGDISLISIS